MHVVNWNRHWTMIYFFMKTFRKNDIEPLPWQKDVLTQLLDHKIQQGGSCRRAIKIQKEASEKGYGRVGPLAED